MHDGLKIMIGAGAAALLAVMLHGPLGQGRAFIDDLQTRANSELATHGLSGVRVDYPNSPYTRSARLSGNVSLVERSDAIEIMRVVRGNGSAAWPPQRRVADAERVALADGADPTEVSEERSSSPPPPFMADVVNARAADAIEQAKAALANPTSANPTPPAPPVAAPSPAPVPPAATAVALPPKPVAPPPPVKPVAVARPAPAPVPASRPAVPLAGNTCQRAIDAAIAGRVMSFRSGSAWLNPQSTKMITDIAAALKRCRIYAIEIGGHTDGNGVETVNRAMSQERADRVRAALAAQGIPAAALSARGYGSARPLRAGNTLDPANRRITFTVTRGGA